MTHPPAWLLETADRVACQFRSHEELAPLGCHYYHEDLEDIWEVTIFVSRTEILGGERDGQWTRSRFSVDLLGLASLFTEVDRFSWQANSLGEGDDLGPHLSLEGLVGEHRLWLRIVADPPSQFEPGRVADVYRERFQDRW